MHAPSAPIAFVTALLAGTLLCEMAAAQSGCSAPSDECVPVGEWDISISLGAGGRSNPIDGNSDIPLVAIPQISYYGKRFFLESLEAGYTLHESDAHTFNLVATPGYDRVFFVRNDLQNVFVSLSDAPVIPGTTVLRVPIQRRHTTYLVGPEWIFRYGDLTGQLDALYEATGRHDGFELRAAVAAPLIQSETSLVASAGLTWKSSELVRYYYGIEGLYAPGSAVNPFVKLAYTRPLTERLSVNAFAHCEYFGNAIADSPIVSDASSITVFAGLVFKIL